MTLLATDNRCWSMTLDATSEVESKPDDLANKKDDNDLRQYSALLSKGPIERKNRYSRRRSKAPVSVDALPIEISWRISLHQEKQQQRRVRNHKKTVPAEISFLTSSSSVHSDIESEGSPQTGASMESNACVNEKDRDFHNKCICVELLESERFDDNCVGMEHLLAMVNRELVNSSSIAMSESSDPTSIAYSLIYKNQNGREFSKRLRDVFPSFLCQHGHRQIQQNNTAGESFETDSTALLSRSFTSTCSRSTAASDRLVCSETDKFAKISLKLPALQILVSSLQLVITRRRISRRQASSSISMDMGDVFWKQILSYMSACLQDLVVQSEENSERSETSNPNQNCSVEAALVVKGLRLLCKLQPEVMTPYVRYSLLPFVSSAMEFGSEQQQTKQTHTKGHRRRLSGDKMLVKECERLLRSFV